MVKHPKHVMDKEFKELIWIIAGCVVLGAGVFFWLSVVYWNLKIWKVVRKIDNLVTDVKEQEILNKL